MKRLPIIGLLLIVLPVGATSIKDWESKSDADQLTYLKSCVAALIASAEQTDPSLAEKIRTYYTVKAPGLKYPEGTYELIGALVKLEEKAKTDSSIDLSRIQVENVVFDVTAKKFGFPPISDGKPKSTPAAAPTPPPQRIKPFVVGKIDVSHFAGLKPGDAEQRVVSLYGPAVMSSGSDKLYGRGGLKVGYQGSVVERVEVYHRDLDGAQSSAGDDALLDLFGQPEADVISLLGPPMRRESYQTGTYNLFWTFPVADRSAKSYADMSTGQTLVLGFRPGGGCFWIGVAW